MPKTTNYAGKSYTFPDEASDKDILTFLESTDVDMPTIYKSLKEVNKEYGFSVDLLYSVANAESSFRPEIITGRRKSKKGASGMMQFMPETAKEMKVDPTDPVASIKASARYLKRLMRRFDDDEVMAVIAYNWGQGNLARQGPEKAPQETRDYVEKVFGIDWNEWLESKRDLEKLEPGLYQDSTGAKYEVDRFSNLKNYDK